LWLTKRNPEYAFEGTLYSGGYEKSLPGYKFGLGITFDRTKNFAWGLDLNFETKGCRIPIREIIFSTFHYDDDYYREIVAAPSKLHSTIRLNYIVVPIRTEFKYKKVYVMQGIYTGFLLHAANNTKFDYENQYFDFYYNVSQFYALMDLGVFLNAGLCFPLSERNSIKIGLAGAWNVSGIDARNIDGGGYSFFNNQVFGLEVKYETKIK